MARKLVAGPPSRDPRLGGSGGDHDDRYQSDLPRPVDRMMIDHRGCLDCLDIVARSRALADRARRWPHFSRVERRVVHILRSHPQFKHGPIDALRLFKAYRLALRGQQ